MSRKFFVCSGLLFVLGCIGSPVVSQPAERTGTFDHQLWDSIVTTNVTESGGFDYGGLLGSADQLLSLETYLAEIAGADLTPLSDEARLAFWINAYNAYTVRGVLDNYPFDSVLNVEGFFDRISYSVAGGEYTLNEIENEQIRPVFNEPRIHFAVNCASRGCPPLRGEAFTGGDLERQLEEQSVSFVRANCQYRANEMAIHLSKIFEWFGADFAGVGGVREFVASRLDADDAAAVRLESNSLVFVDYDWELNAAE